MITPRRRRMARTLWVTLLGWGVLSTPGMAADSVPVTDGAPFQVQGEQVQHAVPAGWRLAWMGGDRSGKGELLLEYLPEGQSITDWRGPYLTLSRGPLPSPALLRQVAATGMSLVQLGSMQRQADARQHCPGTFTEIPPRSDRVGVLDFAVAGGFCDRYGPAAPFGEGALVALVQGKDFVHRIEYHWRPANDAERSRDQPYRIDAATLEQFRQALIASTLCGGGQQPACTAVP